MRLFFALWPDDNIRLALSARRLEVARLTGGRPTLPVTLHLTLVFAGNVPQKRLLEMQMVASRVRAAPFQYRVDTAGCFNTAKVAWLASDAPPQALFDLQAGLFNAVQAADFDVDPRTFRPHITVARHITSMTEAYPIEPCVWNVNKFALVQVEQEGLSVNYEVIDQWPLTG
jgi:2'-5' RNA ligase